MIFPSQISLNIKFLKIFHYIINVFTVTFDQLHSSLLKEKKNAVIFKTALHIHLLLKYEK